MALPAGICSCTEIPMESFSRRWYQYIQMDRRMNRHTFSLLKLQLIRTLLLLPSMLPTQTFLKINLHQRNGGNLDSHAGLPIGVEVLT